MHTQYYTPHSYSRK